jgi:hypothetical protein
MGCDDENIQIHPGASEVVGNGIDEDCQGGDRLVSPETTGLGCMVSSANINWFGIFMLS